MALRACPDCGHQVSAAAIACPNCGRPFSSTVGTQSLLEATLRKWGGIVLVVIVLVILVAISNKIQ